MALSLSVNYCPLSRFLRLPTPEFSNIIGAASILEVEEDLELRALKGTKVVNVKPDRRRSDGATKNTVIQREHMKSHSMASKNSLENRGHRLL